MDKMAPVPNSVVALRVRSEARLGLAEQVAATRPWIRRMVAALRKGEFCSEPARATIPHNFEVITAEGWTCPVRRSPGDAFGLLLRCAPRRALVGMHGLLTETDLLVWQSTTLLHADVERVAGLRGVRIMLQNLGVRVENETVAMPERFPWIFPDAVRTAELEVEERRQAVAAWLTTNRRLCVLYPSGFEIDWYAGPAAFPAAMRVTLPPNWELEVCPSS